MSSGIYQRKIPKGCNHWHDTHPWGYKNNYKLTKKHLNGDKEYEQNNDCFLIEKALEILYKE